MGFCAGQMVFSPLSEAVNVVFFPKKTLMEQKP